MHDLDPLTADARRIVAELTGAQVVRVRRINTGVMTFKYAVSSDSGETYVTRFYPATREFVVEFEPGLVKRCGEIGMKVAEVVGDSRSGPQAGLEYMVYKMLPGRSMDERFHALADDALQRISRDLIAELVLLGKVPILGFGDLVEAGRGRHESWLSFMKEVFAGGIEGASRSPGFPSQWLMELGAIAGRLDRFAYGGPPLLCWGDISPENIILDEHDRMAGLVDFEGAVGAEAQLNHGYLRARFAGTRFWSVFDREWRAIEGFEPARSALYVIVRALRILQYASDPLPTGVRRLSITDYLPGFREAIAEVSGWENQRSVPEI